MNTPIIARLRDASVNQGVMSTLTVADIRAALEALIF